MIGSFSAFVGVSSHTFLIFSMLKGNAGRSPQGLCEIEYLDEEPNLLSKLMWPESAKRLNYNCDFNVSNFLLYTLVIGGLWSLCLFAVFYGPFALIVILMRY